MSTLWWTFQQFLSFVSNPLIMLLRLTPDIPHHGYQHVVYVGGCAAYHTRLANWRGSRSRRRIYNTAVLSDHAPQVLKFDVLLTHVLTHNFWTVIVHRTRNIDMCGRDVLFRGFRFLLSVFECKLEFLFIYTWMRMRENANPHTSANNRLRVIHHTTYTRICDTGIPLLVALPLHSNHYGIL